MAAAAGGDSPHNERAARRRLDRMEKLLTAPEVDVLSHIARSMIVTRYTAEALPMPRATLATAHKKRRIG